MVAVQRHRAAGGDGQRLTEALHPPTECANGQSATLSLTLRAHGRRPVSRPAREGRGGAVSQKEDKVLGLIALLLIVWVVLAVLGFVIKGLFWLAVIGIILFVITGIVGFVRRRT